MATLGEEREKNAFPEGIFEFLLLFVDVTKSGGNDIFFFETLSHQGTSQAVEIVGKAQTVKFRRFTADLSIGQIGKRFGYRLKVLPEQVLRCRHHNHGRFLFMSCLLLFRSQFDGRHIDVVFAPHLANRFGVRHIAMLHQELEDIASVTTCETLVYALDRRNDHGRCLIIVERTKTNVIDPLLLEGDILAYHINDVDGFEDFIDNILWNLIHDSGNSSSCRASISLKVSSTVKLRIVAALFNSSCVGWT